MPRPLQVVDARFPAKFAIMRTRPLSDPSASFGGRGVGGPSDPSRVRSRSGHDFGAHNYVARHQPVPARASTADAGVFAIQVGMGSENNEELT